ncbi:MAG: DNA mismatch repair protein MutS [Chloroflexi bacterium]|nr:DNA mismatch repair protein MutS [Chloroflexota bacterium]MCL5076111.1 DNA mismatch repair protein MutS [Chloroflexota bacterium]
MTPIRRQYVQLKRQYPDAILFFRLGDFYETFDDDAKLVATELEITLTAREMGRGYRVPMAGVPYHAVDGYLAKLINRGYKVAICEQVGDPVSTKGLVRREVVRVLTPGTVLEPNMLQAKDNNYLSAVCWDIKAAGIAHIDITTGEFATCQLTGENALSLLQQELERLRPAECLTPKPDPRRKISDSEMAMILPPYIHHTPYDAWHFDLETAREALGNCLGVSSLEGFGCAGLPLAIRAAGAIVQYLEETQKAALGQLSDLRTYSTDSFMVLDAATRRNLELVQTSRSGSVRGSLLGVLDQTQTPMGGRLLRRWLSQPLLDIHHLRARQEMVGNLISEALLRARLIQMLGQLSDIERIANRVVQQVAIPRDLVALRTSLEIIPGIKQTLAEVMLERSDNRDNRSVAGVETLKAESVVWAASHKADHAADRVDISWLLSQLDECADLASLLAQSIVSDPPSSLGGGGVVAPGFSLELDDLRDSTKKTRQWVVALERTERERTGIRSLKVGYNKVFGYYIEVSKPNLSLVPPEYIRKQTLTGGERFITDELKEKERLILHAQERMVELETLLFKQVCAQVAAAYPRLMATAQGIAHLDVFTALAEVAERNDYTCPELTNGKEISITAGRHPVVELVLSAEPFVPNDIYLSNDEAQVIILTGPNMSGKSTYALGVALIVLMAQIGSFVPAESATIGLVDRIFTRVGAQEDIAGGQSTFMVEMAETANILNHATSSSLIILDEVGRGTSTFDGMAIARAIIEYIHNHPKLGCKTIFATHYHELTELEQRLPRVRNFRVDVLEEGDRVVFLHKVVPGGADRSYGIYVAKLAGIPKAVTRRAEEVLQELERSSQRRSIEGSRKGRGGEYAVQLPLFGQPHPVLEELAALDILSLTPIEALTKLYELQHKVKESGIH